MFVSLPLPSLGNALVVATLALLAPAHSPAGPQPPTATPTTPSTSGPTARAASAGDGVRLHFWSPERGDLDELFDWAYRSFLRDVTPATAEGEEQTAENLFLMGDSIVVYDTDAYAARVLAALAEMDTAWHESSDPYELPDYETYEYSPRYLPVDATLRALEQYEHSIYVEDGAGGVAENANIRLLRERGLILIVDLPAQVARMRALLQRIDVPQPQILITCYLARGADSPGAGVPLPADLTGHLAHLVPYPEFTGLSVGLLRTAAAPGQEISIALPVGPNEVYQLEARTGAYDRESGSLTLDTCAFTEVSTHQTIFRTGTSLARDEYTVIGASGDTPLFVVLQVRPVGG